jgi:signal transduction histidine kinase
MEKDVITGTAEITPTHHGAGLGLWLVKWTAEIFGGELLFEKSEFGGNRIHLRLHKSLSGH